MGQNAKKYVAGLHRHVRKVPSWVFSIVCLGAVLWLTLSPHPLGDNDFNYFFGIDKVAHIIMFMGLTLCFLFDAMRARNWHTLSLPEISLWSLAGMSIGILTEYLQATMNIGRAFEYPDMIADAFGAILAGALWILIGGTLRLTDEEIREHENEKLQGSSDINTGKDGGRR